MEKKEKGYNQGWKHRLLSLCVWGGNYQKGRDWERGGSQNNKKLPV